MGSTMSTVLKNIKATPSVSIKEVERYLAPSQLQAAEKAIRELEKSHDAITNIYKQPAFSISALDIVNFRFLGNVSQAEISEHLYTLKAAVKELEARY